MKEKENSSMTAIELIERLQEYKPATEIYISIDDIDPIGGASKVMGIGEIKDIDEKVDGVYLLGY